MDSKLSKKDVLQAVVLADDFTTNLTPVQNVLPSILLPVIHVPLLDYLIETIVRSRIQELFLYCSNHVELLREYVKQKHSKDFTISMIISDGCRSLGDALRDIDTKGWIRGHFILIRGDAFINADLKTLMNAHLSKFEKDKGAAMTMILRDIGSTNDSFLKEEACVVVSDKTNNKILCYKKVKSDEKKVNLELNWFLDHSEIEINSSCLDTHVYLCSPAVLPLFSDNFDFQTMEDFIRGVLMNEEILGSRIYWQELNSNDYSLPVTSWKTYHSLSHDILQRHSYPLTPNAFSSLKNFVYMPRSTYKHRSATIAKGCIIERECILGQSSSLGNHTSVKRSTVGNNCSIGSNVTIENSHILSNVYIEDGCTIKNSIVFANCTLKKAVQLDGCILSSKTTLNDHAEYIDTIVEPTEDGVSVTKICDLDISDFLFFKYHNPPVCDDYLSNESSSAASSERNSPLPDDTNMFLSEVIDSLLRGYQDKLNCENLILEINSSRYAYNVTIREVSYNVIKAILSLPLHYLAETKTVVTNQNYQKNLKVMINYLNAIVLNYVKTEDAQEDCLHAMEEVASATHELLPFLQHLLHLFYDRDILSEEKILQWYESDDHDFQNNDVRNAVLPFIKWLREAEEDSDSN